MKTYYEIYPIEGWADKISKSLKEIAEDKNRPGMYSKTRTRYQNLANVLLNSLSSIAVILEENLLIPESNNEFDELSSSVDQLDILSKLQLLNNKFKKLEEFSNDSSSLYKSRSLQNLNSGIENIEDDESSDTSNSPPNVDLDITNNQTILYFDDILYQSSIHNFGYSEVNLCAKLIYKWFHTRFRSEYSCDFKYNIKYIPKWISYFIMLYGKYHSEGRNSDFESMINTWCNRVESKENNVYSIPWEIYNLDKTSNPMDCTIDAIVINDILSDNMLYKLSSYEFKGIVNFECSLLITIIKERNPSLHPKIVTRIARRNELIKEIGLTPVGGVY